MARAKPIDLLPLTSIRALLNTCKMALQPIIHQVSALPTESDLEYYFVPVESMDLFRPYFRPGKPYKNLKLINFERPAISLSFYSKHKYTIERGVDSELAQDILKEHRDLLYARSILDELTINQQQKLQAMDRLLQAISQTPNQFQFCVSNYHHYYRYWYCSFRYFEDLEQTKTGTTNEHMLKHTQRTDERSVETFINERLNIIFIDSAYITRPVSYDNKRIDRELDTYSQRVAFGKAALYIRSVDESAYCF